MKVKNDLSDAIINNSILVAMGSHHGIVYRFADGELIRLDEIRVDTPVYSDNEGMFRGGGGAGDSRFGSVLEPKKEKAQHEFSRKMADRVREAVGESHAAGIYLFAPREMKSFIEHDWTKQMKDAVVARFDGNHVAEPAVRLLETIASHAQRPHRQPTGDARRMLERFGALQ